MLAELQGRRFVRVRPCCVAACVAATTLFGGESAAPSPPRPAAAISAVVAWLRALCLNQSGTPFHAVVACSWGSWLCVLFLSVRGCVIWVVCVVVFVSFYVGLRRGWSGVTPFCVIGVVCGVVCVSFYVGRVTWLFPF